MNHLATKVNNFNSSINLDTLAQKDNAEISLDVMSVDS
jgi:hypothetical protein